MTNILVIDAESKTHATLIRCLKTAGFEVINTENNLVHVQLPQHKSSITESSRKSDILHSIFPSIPRLRQVFEFIDLNYHQFISLKDVADEVGYSSAYLTDLVRRLTGKTVNNWIIERRIAQASTLLLETNESVEQIAGKVGYQNINHFYYQFRNYYKSTPRAWRESQRSL